MHSNDIVNCFGFFLLLLNAASTARLNVIANTDCFPFKDDPAALVCRSILPCSNGNNSSVYLTGKYTRFIFDLENRYDIHSRDFFNCTLFAASPTAPPLHDKVELIFKNIKFLNSYAFDSLVISENVTLTLRFDGAGLNLDKRSSGADSRLTISKSTFSNMLFGKNARLNVEVKNYELVECGDLLVASGNGNGLWQHENSEINFDFKNIGQLTLRSNFKITDSSAAG
jgi:hypothetical protein